MQSGGTTSYSALFRGQGTTLTPAVKTGDQGPAGVGVFTSFFGAPVIAANGDLAFIGMGTQTGLCRAHGTVTTALAIDGAQAAGLPDGIIYSDLGSDAVFAMNSSGQVAFLSHLAGPGVDFFAGNDTALFLADYRGTVLA